MGSGIDDRWWLCQGSDNVTSSSDVLEFNPCCNTMIAVVQSLATTSKALRPGPLQILESLPLLKLLQETFQRTRNTSAVN